MASPVHADVSEADRALATQLFKEARVLSAEGRTHEACEKFAESQRLDPSGGTALNLGVCYEAEGKLASAWSVFMEGLSLARRDQRADREKLALEHIAAIEPRLCRLVIEVPAEADVDALLVTRDGSLLNRTAWGVSIPVDPGQHRIEATAPGRKAWSTLVELTGEAERKTVAIPVLEVDAAEPSEAPEVVASTPLPAPKAIGRKKAPEAARDSFDLRQMQRIVGSAAGGIGVVGLVVGTTFGLKALRKQNESDGECRNTCSTRGAELSDEAARAADVATVGFAVGIIGVGAGAYLLLSVPKEKARVGVVVSPRALGLRGAF